MAIFFLIFGIGYNMTDFHSNLFTNVKKGYINMAVKIVFANSLILN